VAATPGRRSSKLPFEPGHATVPRICVSGPGPRALIEARIVDDNDIEVAASALV
jgi:hypothetical protein